MKILIEIMHGIGDTVCALPMIANIRHKYPTAYIVVLVKVRPTYEIIKASQIPVDEIIIFNVYANWKNTFKTIFKLRAYQFDYGISACVTPVKKSKLFMKLCGIKCHVGLQAKGVNIDSDTEYLHFVDSGNKSVRYGFNITTNSKPKLYISEENNWVDDVLQKRLKNVNSKKVVAICIGNADFTFRNRYFRVGKVYTRKWGIHKMHDLIKSLIEENYSVILLGGPNEIPLLEELKDLIDLPQVINMVGRCNMLDSMKTVSYAFLSIGVDTGMQHVAAALGVKTLSIFGPTDPKTHGAYGDKSFFVEVNTACKYCYGTPLYVNCQDRKCLSDITVDDVMSAVRRITAD